MVHQRTLSEMSEIAARRADGVYSRLGLPYRVRNGLVTHVAYCGKLLAVAHGMTVEVGSYEGPGRAALKAITG